MKRTWMAAAVALLALAGCDSRENPAYGGGEVTNTARALYPEGPYGWAEGDTMPDWAFEDADGHRVSMQSIRANTFATTLVLLPSAGWMDASLSMLRRARALHEAGRDDVVLVSAVFEDAQARAASPAEAKAWQTENAIEWPVVAEGLGQFRLAWRNDMRAAVLINLENMQRLSPDARPAIRDVLWP